AVGRQAPVPPLLGCRGGADAGDGGAARAGRLRTGAEGGGCIQPPRRARRDLGDRARRLHRAHPRARESRGPELLRVARAAGFPDARERTRMSTAPLLGELFCEELPPRALARLGAQFAASLSE